MKNNLKLYCCDVFNGYLDQNGKVRKNTSIGVAMMDRDNWWHKILIYSNKQVIFLREDRQRINREYELFKLNGNSQLETVGFGKDLRGNNLNIIHIRWEGDNEAYVSLCRETQTAEMKISA